MPWSAIIAIASEVSAATAYRDAGEKAIAAQKQMYEKMQAIPSPVDEHPPACENCGSSDYQHHHGRLICSYCRSAP